MSHVLKNLSIRDELLTVVGHVRAQYKERFECGFKRFVVSRISTYVTRTVLDQLDEIFNALLSLDIHCDMATFMVRFVSERTRYIRMVNVILAQSHLGQYVAKDIFENPRKSFFLNS